MPISQLSAEEGRKKRDRLFGKVTLGKLCEMKEISGGKLS
ncbi:hypothetical protein CKA32_005606 [Geitlerinema sp. FC II]|nr:hypothetical protein CKA32_005606 [Geitlerinema sp. FC II]